MFTFGNSSSSEPGPDQALTLFQTNDSHFGKLGHVLIQWLLQIVCQRASECIRVIANDLTKLKADKGQWRI